jgi:hypothetical protein
VMGLPRPSTGEVGEFRSYAFARHRTPTAMHPPVLVRHALTLDAKLPDTFGDPGRALPYPGPPSNPFDRLLRTVDGEALKEVSSHFASRHAVEERGRILAVPPEPGADWRDIRNDKPVRCTAFVCRQ